MIKEQLEGILKEIEEIKQTNSITYPVELLAVSKTKPVELILEAYNSGQVKFGENRLQEINDKFSDERLKGSGIDLHLIGHLQRNKSDLAVKYCTTIQSIDKVSTLNAIEKECDKQDKNIDFYIEVNTSNEDQKHGVNLLDYYRLLDEILNIGYKHCTLKGLMTVGPLTDDESKIHKSFSDLKKIFDDTVTKYSIDTFSVLSMGMSSDYAIAIAEGSNMVRIGSKIFGNRSYS